MILVPSWLEESSPGGGSPLLEVAAWCGLGSPGVCLEPQVGHPCVCEMEATSFVFTPQLWSAGGFFAERRSEEDSEAASANGG